MTTTELGALSERIRDVLAIDPTADAVEFEGHWSSWGQLADIVDRVAEVVTPGAEVGILLRNRPIAIGLLLGVLRAGGCVVTINPGRGVERTREDIAALEVSILAGDPADLAELVPAGHPAARLAACDLGDQLELDRPIPPAGPTRPGVAVRMLTSGTTGPPKRIDLTYRTLEKVMVGAKHYESNADAQLRLRRGVAIVNSPLVHLGGLFRVLQCVTDGRSFSLLPRFTLEGWLDAVRRHQPATASLVPTALRMVLDADIDPSDLGSLRSVISGTAPLDPADADAFLEKYGVPVLVNYAATEFGGGVAGWNVADHQEFWASKRGSVGRAHPGCRLRVVDPTTGDEVPIDSEGLLEVQAAQLEEPGWVRTTDLARIDSDGFVFILGRADQAIIRGGFKVRPDDVKAALERHPAVRGASVIGYEDRRLGAVPVAAVELRPGLTAEPEELVAHLEGLLARYEVPTQVRIVDDLPRTDSGKVDLVAVASLFEDQAVD
jgi:acyl-CoA synthetase (AMP-forming)/AMP-acid ligase II